MGQLKKLPQVARKGGSAFVRILARAKAAALRVVEWLRQPIAALSRFLVPIVATGLIALSFFVGYLTGLDTSSEVQDPSLPLQADVERPAAVVGPPVGERSVEGGTPVSETQALSGISDTIAVPPLDGAVVSGPDWVRDPLSGDWIYRYDVLMESKTSGTVRAAMPGVVRSVMSDGETWDVRIDHGSGRVISYSDLEEADVGPGITVTRGQRIGLARNAYDGFRVRLTATLGGEPCSVVDFLQ